MDFPAIRLTSKPEKGNLREHSERRRQKTKLASNGIRTKTGPRRGLVSGGQVG